MTNVHVEGSFKKRYPLKDRITESTRIREKYPDRVPIIVEHAAHSGDQLPPIDKQKYLVPTDLSVGQFAYVIRKRVKLAAEKAMYMMINKKLINTSELMGNVYENNKDADNFLYVIISGESTFGHE